ncbi:TMEM175 family protein [Methanobrevibacter sp.]|uniref:TMEM175 family protein n=1 Tax=Methanobrevibacter sp. TaxID=66852 RepID=UPI00386C751F
MNTNRFETFYDAVLAIVITILVLKIPQPWGPEWGAFISNSLNITTYLIVFLAIINIWYSNQKLFQHIDDINNKSLIAYGVSIFLFSLFPYFASWLSLNPYSLAAETIFGLLIIFANLSHIVSIVVVFGANRSNEKLKELNIKKINLIMPLIIILIGFIISYTVYVPGIYVASLFSIILSIIYNRKQGGESEDIERFEALIDAIIAIIITIIVLEIPIAVGGNLDALLELKMEFIAYAISFIICFNVWNFTYNLFSIVNKINHKSIWSISIGLFFLSLIPYLTTFVSMNFHDFVPNCLYGIDFMIINLCSIVATFEMKKIDTSNKFLQTAFQNYNNFVINIISTLIFIIIGYYCYPPIILISCILSISLTWIFMYKKINLLEFVLD